MKKRLVLDAGSGDNPYFLADILLDLYPKLTIQRGFRKIKIDRPFICADIQHLPFKSQSFFFIYSSHCIEHVDKPDLALMELKRVGRYGYIVFPSRIQEFIFGQSFHQWVIKPNKPHKPLKKGFRPLVWVKNRLWNTNWRIRFRERLLSFILKKIKDRAIIW